MREFFGWRKIKNRRELASLAGLCPTPYDSGESRREQGISKAGNRRLRAMAVEIAWMWLRYQPRSALSCWYERRFGSGNARLRKVGIVALARKLLVVLWKYLDRGEVPEGGRVHAVQSRSSTAGCRRVQLEECWHRHKFNPRALRGEESRAYRAGGADRARPPGRSRDGRRLEGFRPHSVRLRSRRETCAVTGAWSSIRGPSRREGRRGRRAALSNRSRQPEVS